MKTVLGVRNRNSVFQKAAFHHGKNGLKVVTFENREKLRKMIKNEQK